jgi:hypothetical protein
MRKPSTQVLDEASSEIGMVFVENAHDGLNLVSRWAWGSHKTDKHVEQVELGDHVIQVEFENAFGCQAASLVTSVG